MNKIITVFAMLFATTAVVAAPGGHGGFSGHGGSHRGAPARQVQRAPAPRPAAHASRPAPHAGRPAVHHSRPPAPRPVVHRPPHGHVGPRVAHPPQHRHWLRPPMPPLRPRALHSWVWVASPWTILVNGIYCTGDGYWFDGFNYYYNDGYYTSAPISVNIGVSF